MFCSNCGKTIHTGETVCPSCKNSIGESRFGGIPYTSMQAVILPDEPTDEPLNNYARTNYTSMADAEQEKSDLDSRTTYRPLYEGVSTPVEVRRDMRAAFAPEPEPEEEAEEEAEEEPVRYISPEEYSQTGRNTLDELDEELQPDEQIDLSQFRSRPIRSNGRAGISQDVSDYIRKLEEDQSRRGRRCRAAEVYDDYEERDPDDENDYPETDEPGYAGDEYPEDEDYDGEDYDDEDYYDEPRAPRFNVKLLIKIVVALALAGLLIWGVIRVVGNIKENTSSAPIEGVSETLYTEGIALIKAHADGEYTAGLISMYPTDGMLPVATKLMEDRSAISALLPEEAAVNDATFISALETIQENIENAITMDALSVNTLTESDIEDSENRWAIVNNSIAQLESATSAAELTAIIYGQKVTVESATPEPTATATVYTTLSNGDKGDNVLKLQNRLYELGYLNDDRDGAFGGKTQTAVKMFQQRMGIDATGIADNETQTLLYADSALYAEGATTPTPAPTATPEPEAEDLIAPAEAMNGDT